MTEAGPSTSMADVVDSTARQLPHAQLSEPVGFSSVEETTVRLDEAQKDRLIERMIARVAQAQGYDGIEASALDYIVNSVEDVMTALLTHAHELAMVARRNVPSARDGFAALQQAGPRIQPNRLQAYVKHRRLRSNDDVVSIERIKHRRNEWLAPSDEWLPSDEEENGEEGREDERGVEKNGKRRKRYFRPEMNEVPSHLPALPPKHTWLFTPSFPVRSEDTVDPLAYIDIKVSSTRLTEASLRGLISATDNAAFLSREGQSKKEAAVAKTDLTSISPRSSLPPNAQRASSPANARRSAVASTATQASVAPPLEEESRPTRKPRPLSLRLRTSSANISATQPQPSIGGENAASPSGRRDSSIAAPKRFALPNLSQARPSLSASLITTPRSATPLMSPALTSLRRSTMGGNVGGSGPWTSMPTQSYFSWGPPTPGMTPSGEPLATPLTPGGFVYPPTPAGIYAGDSAFDQDGTVQGTVDDEGEVTLPGVVNYKKSWYRKTHSNAAQLSNGVRKEETHV